MFSSTPEQPRLDQGRPELLGDLAHHRLLGALPQLDTAAEQSVEGPPSLGSDAFRTA